MLGSPASYMTLQLLPSEFPYVCGKFYFLLYQCEFAQAVSDRGSAITMATHRIRFGITALFICFPIETLL
jgi:hypothetical protein